MRTSATEASPAGHRRHVWLSMLALIGAGGGALLLAAIGATGLAPAISSSLLVGVTVAALTYVILQFVGPARRPVTDGTTAGAPAVVRTAVPALESDEATGAWDAWTATLEAEVATPAPAVEAARDESTDAPSTEADPAPGPPQAAAPGFPDFAPWPSAPWETGPEAADQVAADS